MEEYPFIFGTAGHIDHGKTALVRAMTGIDCDRLEEEKRRGITIELGFAPLNLPNGKTVSIVDVPGHERFIRTMASGAAGMDAAMLIIAATEGVMPQTREHLDILNILGVRFGLVALTKKDLADDETLELATAEVLELVRGTCLDGAPIIPVSSVTGEGVSQILEEIEKIIGKIPPREGRGAFFLPIDRVFSKKGFGSVVTGTSYQGSLSEGDEVEIMPTGAVGRVRSLQTHGAKVASVTAGQRVAVNLAGVSHDQIERGSAVCEKGAFIATDCISAWLEILPSALEAVAHWQRVRLHVGTTDVVARISLLRMNAGVKKSGIVPGNGAPVQILCESKITVAAGQRFVIRFYSPLMTIGGGRIMLPNAELAKGKADREAKARIVESLAADFSPVTLLAAIIHDKGILSVSGLSELSQMGKDTFTESLSVLSSIPDTYAFLEFGTPQNFISSEAFDTVTRSALRILHEFHAKYPELSGLDAEKLFTSLDSVHGSGLVKAGDFKVLLGIMAARNAISPVAVQGKTCYRAADYRQAVDSKLMDLAGRIREAMTSAGFNLLKLPELEEKLGVSSSDIKRAVAYLREQDDLRTIEGGLLFSREMRDKLLKALSSMSGDITVASLRDSIGVNRKESLAMLDFLDAQGLTKRVGDTRVLVG
ncbi:selenocysteine-specific translation elongation factor [Treponema primitia ZAS-2]|uniref:Selenocysteine-specific elongation factor n=1 Tax=Treponema primitia (strain ATCC BAA-887 / DSM 12427 / ZAS-2) TaxID=545694 RepID=D8L162_TREPZ|nr:selenocysteine-specific translation elongation factor [Treponema primitia]ADJ19606.1 putative selenocysteine-specific translation elongation factor [Treponema primitia ZAS-2]AEF85047.1 selenocysteine-specific translation elongation factor [Treponema primitia ZAS-2]